MCAKSGFKTTAAGNGKVTIIGENPIAELLLAYCISIGFGGIRVLLSSEGFLDKLGPLEEIVSKMNPAIHFNRYFCEPDEVSIGNPDIIIDASENIGTKKASFEIFKRFAETQVRRAALYISTSTSENSSSVFTIASGDKSIQEFSDNMLMESQRKQDFSESAITAGLVSGQILRFLNSEECISKRSYQWPQGFYPPSDLSSNLENKRVAVVGAGGTGTSALLALAHSSVSRVDIFEDDIIEGGNLNRQYLFFQKDIGKPKAEVISKRLSTINPKIRFVPHKTRIYKENAQRFLSESELIFSCVDNELARKTLSFVAAKKGIPLIDAGVDEASARVEVFLLGKNYCQNCMHDYQEEENLGPGCTHGSHNLQKSTIAENAIAGTLMADLAIWGLSSEPKKELYGAKYEAGFRVNQGPITFFTHFPRNRAKNFQCKCRSYFQ